MRFSDERIAEEVRSLNRQEAEAKVAGYAALRSCQDEVAVEHFYLASQLTDRCVDLLNTQDEAEDDYAASANMCAPAPLGELDVMEAMVGLFSDLNNGAKHRVLTWAQARFLG